MSHTVGDVLRLVKFSHTLFALPFALASFALATARAGFDPTVLLWVLVAMVGMRSAAMSFNRLADADIDARNPRTATREIPAGILSRRAVAVYVVVFSALFYVAAYMINDLTWKLSPLAWAVCLGYSLCKRVTWLSHFVLGLALGLSPVGAWIAVTGTWDPVPVWMGVVVLLWTAGFDILYAAMDLESDRRNGLHSVPARFGWPGARRLARACHVGMIAAWAGLVHAGGFGGPMIAAGVIAGALVVLEHALADPGDLAKMNLAFFKINVVVSVVMLLGAGTEVWL